MAQLSQYAPDFGVRINGQDLPTALRASIASVQYEDGMNGADRVEIGIANAHLRWLQKHIRGLGFRPFPTSVHEGPMRRPSVVPEGLFDVDNSLTLSMGYAPYPLEKVFYGEITGIEAEFPQEGMPTMKLVAHDHLHRLSQGKYSRGFGPLPDVVVAAILGAENLLAPFIDPNVIAASTAMAVLNVIFHGSGTKQKAQSHLELMQEIADRYDADFWVEGDMLYLSRFMKEYTPRLTLAWGESLLSFSPRVSTIGQVAGVAAKFTLREIPLDFLVTVAWDFDRECIKVSVVPGQAGTVSAGAETLVGPLLTLIKHPIGSPADIANSALFVARKLRNKINNRLTGSGSAVGDPRIRAGAVIKLEGLGPNFSGNYRVTSSLHTIGPDGYRTRFKVRKEIIP